MAADRRKVVYLTHGLIDDGHRDEHDDELYAMLAQVLQCGAVGVSARDYDELVGAGKVSHEAAAAASRALIRRSDALVALPGWQDFTETREEVEAAREANLPVFDAGADGGLERVFEWLGVAGEAVR